MPALRLFGRKWLAASDDLVFPGLFEICFRLLWYVLQIFPIKFDCFTKIHLIFKITLSRVHTCKPSGS